MPPLARPYRPADRAGALALLLQPGAIDSPGHVVDVVEEAGQVVGAAVGIARPDGDYRIGAILLADDRRMDLFHQLLVAQLERAQRLGFTYLVASTASAPLMAWVRRAYPPDARTASADAGGAPVDGWYFRLPIAFILAALPRDV